MDKYFRIVVTIAVLGHTSLARSYNTYYDHRFEKSHHGFQHGNDYHHIQWSESERPVSKELVFPIIIDAPPGGPRPDWQTAYHGHYTPEVFRHLGNLPNNPEYFPKEIGYPKEYSNVYKHFESYWKQVGNVHKNFQQYWKNGGHNPKSIQDPHLIPISNGGQEFPHGVPIWRDNGWVFPDSDRGDVPPFKPWVSVTPPAPRPTIPVTISSRTTSTSTSSPRSTTPSTLSILTCMRSCPVTPEYNPVCGSNNITYNNPGRLECARRCGVDVTIQRLSRCPTLSPPINDAANGQTVTESTTTPRIDVTSPNPITNVIPTRFTTIDANPLGTNRPPSFTPIPDHILESIFSKPTSDEDQAEIDIRTRDS